MCRCHLLRCLTGLSRLSLAGEGVTGASLFPAEVRARVDVGVRDAPTSVCCCARCCVCSLCLCARGACVDARSAKPCLLKAILEYTCIAIRTQYHGIEYTYVYTYVYI